MFDLTVTSVCTTLLYYFYQVYYVTYNRDVTKREEMVSMLLHGSCTAKKGKQIVQITEKKCNYKEKKNIFVLQSCCHAAVWDCICQ